MTFAEDAPEPGAGSVRNLERITIASRGLPLGNRCVVCIKLAHTASDYGNQANGWGAGGDERDLGLAECPKNGYRQRGVEMILYNCWPASRDVATDSQDPAVHLCSPRWTSTGVRWRKKW